MRIQDYVNIIRKRWWLVALVGLTAALAAYGFSKLQTPMYRAQAEYVAVVNRLDSGAAYTLDKTMNGFIKQVLNRDRLGAIAQQLQLDVSADVLLRDVRMQAQANPPIIVIEADSAIISDPPRLINAVGDALLAVVAENNRLAEGQDRVNVRRTNPNPVFQSSPQTKINTLAGGILGGILGLLLAFFLEYLDDTLKNSADVERFAGLTTIGQIPSGAAQATRRARLRPAAARIVGNRHAD